VKEGLCILTYNSNGGGKGGRRGKKKRATDRGELEKYSEREEVNQVDDQNNEEWNSLPRKGDLGIHLILFILMKGGEEERGKQEDIANTAVERKEKKRDSRLGPKKFLLSHRKRKGTTWHSLCMRCLKKGGSSLFFPWGGKSKK